MRGGAARARGEAEVVCRRRARASPVARVFRLHPRSVCLRAFPSPPLPLPRPAPPQYYYHVPSGHSQWEVPSSDALSPVEAPWNPAAAGKDGDVVRAAAAGQLARCGYLDTGKLLRATLFLPAVVHFEEDGANNYFFALAGGVLAQFEDEKCFHKKEAAMDTILISAFTVLEAPDVLGTGASAAKAVAAADAGRSLTLLLSADAKAPNPRVLYLRAPDQFARNEWARAMMLAGAGKP